MRLKRLTVFELAPAADELWELPRDSRQGHLCHAGGMVLLPDVARGAKLRPRVRAAYAGGKATNVARVFDAFLRPDAHTPLARQAQTHIRCCLATFLPVQAEGYRRPEIPGPVLAAFTPGGAYLACLQARDFHAVMLEFRSLPPTCNCQSDRRCANIVSADGHELVNFSPHLHWESPCVTAVLDTIGREPPADVVALAGSLPLVDGKPRPRLYAEIIARIRQQNPDSLVSLDVGGAPLRACLEGGPHTAPSVVCINMAEFSEVPHELWQRYTGIAVIHNKCGCWVLQGQIPPPPALHRRPPDIAVPADMQVRHTICAGDAAHGGLLLGLMLHGTDPTGLRRAAVLSQACAMTVVESEDSIRGVTADKVAHQLTRLENWLGSASAHGGKC